MQSLAPSLIEKLGHGGSKLGAKVRRINDTATPSAWLLKACAHFSSDLSRDGSADIQILSQSEPQG
jgi:hypothetical protein